ncbi:uncharacterized protein LOC126680410 [Mercurialis annua]|uniref:uncharacterized protein LOC126680410 n=1 Tax=Mercurialis annua TaxID=3986 RepID=UPI0024AF4769|nr:uncharacterized protein LOC126680410 [Mercurialis annua]XP_055962155.1 uncharacterized protein LOC126680410 [Mercurialis annua]
MFHRDGHQFRSFRAILIRLRSEEVQIVEVLVLCFQSMEQAKVYLLGTKPFGMHLELCGRGDAQSSCQLIMTIYLRKLMVLRVTPHKISSEDDDGKDGEPKIFRPPFNGSQVMMWITEVSCTVMAPFSC